MPRRRSRSSSRHVSPYRLFFIVGGLLTALLACVARWPLDWPWPWAYLAAVNLTTAGFYGYDKHQSSAGGLRIPEKVLHFFAFAGGTPAAYVSQRLFRHKTIKGNFQVWFWTIFLLQLAVILVWWWFR